MFNLLKKAELSNINEMNEKRTTQEDSEREKKNVLRKISK